jgi:flagellar secretion chaperone FliS
MDSRYQTYRTTNINTVNRGKLVVMLFSGAISFLGKARMSIEKRDFYNKGKYITKAQNIVDELNFSLDMEKGEEIAQNLRSIYLFLTRYLSKANVKNDMEMLNRAISILETLKSAFDEIVTNPEYEEARILNRQEAAQNSIRRLV